MAQPLPSKLTSAMRFVLIHLQIDLHPVAAERIVPFGHVVGRRQRAEMARMPANDPG